MATNPFMNTATDPNNVQTLLKSIYGDGGVPGMRTPGEAGSFTAAPPPSGAGPSGADKFSDMFGIGTPANAAEREREAPPKLEDFQKPPQHLKGLLDAEVQRYGGYGPRARQIQQQIEAYTSQAQARHKQAMQEWQDRQNQIQSHDLELEKARKVAPFHERLTGIAENLPWANLLGGATLTGATKVGGRMWANKLGRNLTERLEDVEGRAASGGLKRESERNAARAGLRTDVSRLKAAEETAGQTPWGTAMLGGAGIGVSGALMPSEFDLSGLPQNTEAWQSALKNLATPDMAWRIGGGALSGMSGGLLGAKIPTLWPKGVSPLGPARETINRLGPKPRPLGVQPPKP